MLDEKGITHIIPPRKNMKLAKTYTYDKEDYLKRIRIEHIFGRIKNHKRIRLRSERKLKQFSGFVYLSLTIITINIINRIYENN